MNKLSRHPITRVIDAVAEAENVEPLSLDPPLAEVVDPDALETLVEETTATDLAVRFAYRDHDIAVDESGRVQVS